MELCNVLKAQEEDGGKGKETLSATAMDEAHPEDEDEEDEVEEKDTKTQGGRQDMPAEEQGAASEEAVTEKSHMTR